MLNICMNCFLYYHEAKDPASVKNSALYCSPECEAADEARLKAGNDIIAQAEKENPALFATKIEKLPEKIYPGMKIPVKFSDTPENSNQDDINKLIELLNQEKK